MKLFNDICEFLIKAKQDPSITRRKETEKEADKISLEGSSQNSFIICNGNEHSIDWDNVIPFNHTSGLSLPKNCYKRAKNERKPTMFVSHWDVCLSSKSCFNILKKRKLSVHFLIDNDGTIFQLMDCNDIGFHAGNRKVNNNSVGVEISNAYYPKYQNIYRSKGFGPRPVWKNIKVHDQTLEPFLGFYPVQQQAFQALAKTLNKVYDIPLETPMNGDNILTTIDPAVYKGTYKGVINHYHVTKRKIDCAGFELDKLLKEIA
mgnify:FL=1